MGDTGSNRHTRWSDLLAYFQQRSLSAVGAARRTNIPCDAPPQQGGGATANGPGRVQSKKMKPRPMAIADIIQHRSPQMPRAEGVKERSNPVLHKHFIICM